MSPHEHVSNFAHDLVQMALATQRLPELEARVKDLVTDNDELRDTIQRLELRAIDRNKEHDALVERIRSLEVERDNAQFRGLELEEQLAQYRSFIGAFRVEADQLAKSTAADVGVTSSGEQVRLVESPLTPSQEVLNTIDPNYAATFKGLVDAPQDVGQGESATSQDATTAPVSIGEDAGGQSEVSPTASGSEHVESVPIMPQEVTSTSAENSGASMSEGDRATPFAAMSTTTTESSSETLSPAVSTGDAGNTESVSSPKPYEGLLYTDYPNYVTFYDWLMGGGTEESYNYRHPTVHSGHWS